MSESTTFDADESAQKIPAVSDSMQSCLDIETVGQLAATQTEVAVDAVEDIDGVNEGTVVGCIRSARRGLGYNEHIDADVVADELSIGDETSIDPDEAISVNSGSDEMLDELVDEVDGEADDEYTLLLIAGDGSKTKAVNEAVQMGKLDEFSVPGQVTSRLVQAGEMAADGGWEFDEILFCDPTDYSSAGAEWVTLWLQHIRDETDDEMPDWSTISIDEDVDNFGEACNERRTQAVAEANKMVIVENGDWVGDWVRECQSQSVPYDTPGFGADHEPDRLCTRRLRDDE